ncbi:MAG: hypothetical protein SGJ20_14290 [Planctomycetota bacterium]|nr:hypothetical protein [Planctomycetota bacterium]
MFGTTHQRNVRKILCGMAMTCSMGAVGCQVDVGGQTLPSAYYLKDDIQFFPAGPRMKLSREAAAQKASNEEQAVRMGRENNNP